MLIRITKSKFSSLTFPYNFKGIEPTTNDKVTKFALSLFGHELSSGFSFAYQNLLESLVSSDYKEFLKDNCDQRLREGFEKSLKKFSETKQSLKIQYDNEIQENVLYSHLAVHFFSNPHKDLRDQTPRLHNKISEEVSVSLYDDFKQMMGLEAPRPIIELNLYIKSPCYLTLENNNNKNIFSNVYHKLDCRTQSNDKMSIMQFQKINQEIFTLISERKNFENKEKLILTLLGNDYSWKILNLDEYK